MNYKILSKIHAGIVLGNSLRYIFEGIIPEEKIYVVKNCVDDEFVISNEEFNEKMLSLENKEEFRILYLSNFIKEKGYKEVLQLAKLVKENNDKRFKFIFAGKFFDNDDKKDFFEYIDKNELNHIIEYKGIVGGNDKIDLLRKCDIFILLTRYKNEGQPISIIEAAGNGLEIIATNHSGINDILGTNEMIFIEKENIKIEKIYAELIKAIDEKEIDRLNRNREKILVDFSEEKYLSDFKIIFNSI